MTECVDKLGPYIQSYFSDRRWRKGFFAWNLANFVCVKATIHDRSRYQNGDCLDIRTRALIGSIPGKYSLT